MSAITAIEWTHIPGYVPRTWNPVIGCTRVSAGCKFCYAYELHDRRHKAWKDGNWPAAPRQYHKPFSELQVMTGRFAEPRSWTKKSAVFVNSFSDLFHDEVSDCVLAELLSEMAFSKHIFMILTKRPERMAEFVTEWRNGREPVANIFFGVSVENEAALKRIPILLQTPAVVKFLSCEPLLGPLILDEYLPQLQWVIVGGESGPKARPMEERWAIEILDQCKRAGTPFFFKQWGAFNSDGVNVGKGKAGRDLLGQVYGEWPAMISSNTNNTTK